MNRAVLVLFPRLRMVLAFTLLGGAIVGCTRVPTQWAEGPWQGFDCTIYRTTDGRSCCHKGNLDHWAAYTWENHYSKQNWPYEKAACDEIECRVPCGDNACTTACRT